MRKEREFIRIIEKLIRKLGLRTDGALARKLEIKQSTFSERKKRESIPYEEIINFCDNENISLDWLFFSDWPANRTKSPVTGHQKNDLKIDAPEMYTPEGRKAKEYVIELVEGKLACLAHRNIRGYYGRLLADVYVDGENIAPKIQSFISP